MIGIIATRIECDFDLFNPFSFLCNEHQFKSSIAGTKTTSETYKFLYFDISIEPAEKAAKQ